ncbi:MAG: PQQ-binding-like beta-propeller repeat protein [Verrucomicrobiales bacterium]|nr:PQQ-binding-like beta-propeller repeat protein [Verrucomicrobiales bacterium]
MKFSPFRTVFSGLLLALILPGCSDDDQESNGETTGSDPGAVSVTQDWPLFRRNAEMQGNSLEDLKPPLKPAWKFEPPVEEGKSRFPIDASPVISNGTVFIGSQDALFFAIDLQTGEEKWTFETDGGIKAPAGVFGETVYVGDTYGIVYALATADGAERWRYETDDQIEGGVNGMEIDGQLRIFIGSHDVNLYAFNTETGKPEWMHETGSPILATPAIIENLQAITFGGCDEFFHVVDAKRKLEPKEIQVGGNVLNTSAVRDGIAYLCHYGGVVMAIDVESGEKVWEQDTGVEYKASPAVGEKLLFVAGGDKRLVAYDRVTGDEVWAFRGRRSFDSSPVVCESAVWIGGGDGYLYAIDPATGKELWSYDLGTQIKASLAISRQTLVVCGDDGVVYAFRPEDS